MIDVLVVAYRSDATQMGQVVSALCEAAAGGVPLSLRVWHNDEVPGAGNALHQCYEDGRARGLPVQVLGGRGNLGFGVAINRLADQSAGPYLLVLNDDAIPEAGALHRLWNMARRDASDVAAWEMRQIPYEHPKAYDPVTLDVEWVSAAAVLLRADAFRKVGGFEPRIFMYGEDVDLSWRLRCAGWRLRYVPQAAVVHHTYREAAEVKPLQVFGGIYANLCLRTRYSGHKRILQGLSLAMAEMLLPQSFAGRRAGIARAIWRFVCNYRYFWATHQQAPGFEPVFAGWGYEQRREGAFHAFLPRTQQPAELPLVSVLIRTHRRAAMLRQALTSVLHQTHRPIEVIVVEDGSAEAESVCREFDGQMDVRYFRLSPGRGRSAAGNLALAQARGQWLCFLDDDDVLFADHVEVLLQTARAHQVRGAYALAWRTITRMLDESRAEYQELWHVTAPDEPFSRVAMWHHNFMPIQAVLFHRSLYERHGGLAEDMDQLEDWNLWTRYTLHDDFVQVRKVTSKYRVPAETQVTAERQAKLDAAYRDAVARQSQMQISVTPATVRQLAEDYVRSNAVLHIGRDSLRAHAWRWPWLRRVTSLRHVLIRYLRRGR